MASVVAKLSNTHDDIMNCMVANPMAGLRELSALTGYSVPWLSQLVNSDIFRAKLAEKKNEVFIRIADDVPAKLSALAHQAVDKLAEKLEAVEDPDFALDVFDKVMKANGYAPGGKSGTIVQQQQNNFFISKDDLAKARGQITQNSSPVPQLVDGEVVVND